MLDAICTYARLAAGFVRGQSPEEREKRAGHAFALALVLTVAIVKGVTGLTDDRAAFTLYAIAVAVSAARGGFAPAFVATLGSMLVGGIVAWPLSGHGRVVFAAEALSIGLVVSEIRSRLLAGEGRIRAADTTAAELRHRSAVNDLATRREWDNYREAARRAQAALEQVAEQAKQQLAALESLTDPSLNPLEGPVIVTELLERLRTTVAADGAAFVQPGLVDGAIVTARGLQPTAGPFRSERRQLASGRVAVVHNDPARVEQVSGLRWPSGVTSLLVVPVVRNGQAWSTIEVANERPRHVSDWDVALARVVADRLAAVAVQDRARAARAS